MSSHCSVVMIQLQDDAEHYTNDPESSLQMALSALAEQEDLFSIAVNATETTPATTISSHPSNPRVFLDWLIQALSPTVPSSNEILPEANTSWYSWWRELSQISILLPSLSPYELHSVANEMIWMPNGANNSSNGAVTYPSICLLLCIHALQQAPSPKITSRSKRWQSLECETIRQFQIHWEQATNDHDEEEDEDDPMIDKVSTLPSQLVHQLWTEMWSQHVVPAALKVLVALPEDAAKVAIQCGLIATTTQLVAFCSTTGTSSSNGDDSEIMKEYLQTFYLLLRTILAADLSETTTGAEKDDEPSLDLWMYPWLKHEAEISGKYFKKCSSTDGETKEDQWYDEHDDDDDDDDFATFREDAVWWASQVQHHQHVVGMSTTYDDLGLAILAYYGWEDRPQVLTPTYAWKVWFPHLKTLLVSSQLSGGVLVQRMGFLFFEQFLNSTSPSSIAWEYSIVNDTSSPGSPFPIFHLLSNRMLVLHRPDVEDPEEQANLKRQTDQMVLWIKTLLYCYQPIDQVDIVQRLVQDCPYPGLQALFLDALRPLILRDDDQEVASKLWKYIGSLLEALQKKYMPHGSLVEVEDLIDHLEVYIGSIAMLQLYVLVKSTLPSGQASGGETLDWEGLLKGCYQVLTETLRKWETDSLGSLPPGAFRLNLLEVSMSEMRRFLVEATRGTTKA